MDVLYVFRLLIGAACTTVILVAAFYLLWSVLSFLAGRDEEP